MNEGEQRLTTSTNSEGNTVVTVDQGKIYVAKEKDPTPINIRYTVIGVQAGISMAVVAVCAYVITNTPVDQNQRAVAWSTLASTLTLWLPSPSSNANK